MVEIIVLVNWIHSIYGYLQARLYFAFNFLDSIFSLLKVLIKNIKASLYSRFIFNNAFSLLFNKVLIELGYNARLKARINNCIIELDAEVLNSIVRYSLRGAFKSVKCVEGKIYINDVEVKDINKLFSQPELLALLLAWRYDASCDCWWKDRVKFRFMHKMILETFDLNVYGAIDVNDKIVVDVGSFIGDTPIYFALKSAKSVIAIEPHQEAFNVMIKNIKLNNLQNKIIPINAGLASKQGKICIDERIGIEQTWYSYHGLGECQRSIPAITLKELVAKYNLNDAVLKMDCEGCEHDVILNSYEDLLKFKEIIFEYHGDPIKLLQKLSHNYRCKVVASVLRILSLGTIYCIRIR
jgi:FkbM family methyltransferase